VHVEHLLGEFRLALGGERARKVGARDWVGEADAREGGGVRGEEGALEVEREVDRGRGGTERGADGERVGLGGGAVDGEAEELRTG